MVNELDLKIESWGNEILSQEFKTSCALHLKGLGYLTKSVGDQVCIIDSDGESSCHPGTLVGWKFVDDIENYLSNNGFPWFKSQDRTPQEIAKGSHIVTALTKDIIESIKEDGDKDLN